MSFLHVTSKLQDRRMPLKQKSSRRRLKLSSATLRSTLVRLLTYNVHIMGFLTSDQEGTFFRGRGYDIRTLLLSKLVLRLVSP